MSREAEREAEMRQQERDDYENARDELLRTSRFALQKMERLLKTWEEVLLAHMDRITYPEICDPDAARNADEALHHGVRMLAGAADDLRDALGALINIETGEPT